ncbi:MAG TPA: Nramp family divalent metal transporter [Terriglobales bacterium]|nr:Nramp family divalent metal transporter [Terriglobales bacterium]
MEVAPKTPASSGSAAPPGSPRGWRSHEIWLYFGPAFVASVAYIDPGNFATNIQGGAQFGYRLLWVLLWSNLTAMLVQFLAAKLGIATGRTLPQLCRDHFPRPLVIVLWIIAEVAAMATDVAEFVGAALGFYLLLHLPLFTCALITTAGVFLILAIEVYGFRRLEHIIMLFVGVIAVSYFYEILLARPEWRQVAMATFLPHIDRASAYIAVGMLGATVMPHVVYLHSALVQHRYRADDADHSLRHARYEFWDVMVAMNGSWLVNSAMLIMAAAVFYRGGFHHLDMTQAHQTLAPILGPASAFAFALALLCSGLSSSVVGTMAGQVVLEGFLHVNFNIFYRRALTVIPALVVIAMGLDPLRVIVFTQVVLSFALPFAIVPLILLVQKESVMGKLAVQRTTAVLGWLTTAAIVGLNGFLIYLVAVGQA